MKSKKLIYLFFAFSIFVSENIFSQGVIENNISEYMKNYYVEDLCFSNNVLWVVAEKIGDHNTEVIRCDKEQITRYFIDHMKNGKLSQFLCTAEIKNIHKDSSFTPSLIKCTKERVWLVNERDMKFAMIQNDSIWFDKYNIENQQYVADLFYSNDTNRLYILNRYDLDGNRFKSNGNKLFCFGDEKKIIQREMPLKIDSIYAVTGFFINCDKKAFLISKINENSYCNLYITGKNDSLLKIIGPFENEFLCDYFIDDQTIYLILMRNNDTPGNFIVLDSDMNYHTYNIPKINSQKLTGCVSFVVLDNVAYIADAKGFYKYEYLIGQISSVNQTVRNNEDSRFSDSPLRNLRLKNGIIYGSYSGFNALMRCQYSNLPGIFIYRP